MDSPAQTIHRVLLAALAVLGGCAKSAAPGGQPAATSDPIREQLGLVAAPGREQVIAHCLVCHSSAIVVSNHLDRAGWEDIVDQMQHNGMRPIDAAIREAIVAYLERTQRPDESGAVDGPWAAPRYRPNPLWH
ncbi:MAG: hypothetical protein KDC87_04910 [Planctomycetes bacterium]|nr:hypothetical protein [Planctomycetota bacterium]MCB9868786.1 hypothetical protein [Planctomycetota bacterium]